MDINERINWKPGMELTSQTFKGLDANIDFRQAMALKAALGGNRMGVLPRAELNVDGMFARNNYEIDQFKCLAVLPSGRIISADERVEVSVSSLFSGEYYLTVGFSDIQLNYEKDDVQYVRPQYEYKILSPEETANADVLPIVHFITQNNVFAADTDYIIPCLLFDADERFDKYRERFAEQLEALSAHQNMADGDGKRAMLHYMFLLKGFNKQSSVHNFVQLTQEIAQAVDYYIVSPNTEKKEIPYPSQINIVEWFKWLEQYLAEAALILNDVVLPEPIDYEALLAQAKAELYKQLHPELLEDLLKKTKEEILNEIDNVKNDVTTYINDSMKPEVRDELSTKLDEKTDTIKNFFDGQFNRISDNVQGILYDDVYNDLFWDLYDALFVPEEEDDFIPKI